jgi:tetratricopeptide (TPR) repeat protein
MDFAVWLEGTGGLLSGLGTFFLGIAALIPHIKKWLRQRNMYYKGESMEKKSKMRNISLILGILLVVISISIFTSRVLIGQEQSLNVELTTKAWKAYNNADYNKAISYAEKCINEFRGAAKREQEQLEMKKVPLPPTGKVSDQERKLIWAKGLLNDVGTCFYIKGRSLEELGQKEEAKKAYQNAAEYTYARCWDPKGWFWDPSEAASDRLRSLR